MTEKETIWTLSGHVAKKRENQGRNNHFDVQSGDFSIASRKLKLSFFTSD